MPKRMAESEESLDSFQPIKKQHNSKHKSRKIRSSSSERTLQLLFEGINRGESSSTGKSPPKVKCFKCSTLVTSTETCSFCEHDVCQECTNLCYKCQKQFCPNCSFSTYDQRGAVCYSCYVYK